jgi:hypothetical protein
MKSELSVVVLVILGAMLLLASPAMAQGRGDGPVVYVTSQDLYYDSIITIDPLPDQGPFQLLEMGPNGLQTEFGPGDRGYVGGRWIEDIDGDGVYHTFSCPLLGPGRDTP